LPAFDNQGEVGLLGRVLNAPGEEVQDHVPFHHVLEHVIHMLKEDSRVALYRLQVTWPPGVIHRAYKFRLLRQEVHFVELPHGPLGAEDFVGDAALAFHHVVEHGVKRLGVKHHSITPSVEHLGLGNPYPFIHDTRVALFLLALHRRRAIFALVVFHVRVAKVMLRRITSRRHDRGVVEGVRDCLGQFLRRPRRLASVVPVGQHQLIGFRFRKPSLTKHTGKVEKSLLMELLIAKCSALLPTKVLR
jgi:hypothetical protein